jgi:hypothetical protein
MSFFERPDPRIASSADQPAAIAVIRTIGRHAIALIICCVISLAIYAVDVAYGLHGVSRTGGVIAVRGLSSVVTIVRDDRDVPHVRARDDWDMYFGEGYAQGSDRLFQLDLTRRYAYGTLSEVLGARHSRSTWHSGPSTSMESLAVSCVHCRKPRSAHYRHLATASTLRRPGSRCRWSFG